MLPGITEELIGRQSPEAQAIIRLLLTEITALRNEVTALREEVVRLKRTPRNSSRPPSTEHPHAKPAPPPVRGVRKSGGQPGHDKHARALLPTAQCDDVREHRPVACRRCGTKLSGTDPQPLRQQVYEFPEIHLHVTEHRRHRLTCRGCGESTCAAPPTGVPSGQAGSRLTALIGLLMAHFRQSKRRTALFLEACLNFPCSSGWIVKVQQQVSAAVQPVYDELVAALPTQSRLGIDESPTKEGRRKAWQWTFVADQFTVFAHRLSRSGDVLDELLTGRFRGVVTCDRARMYWRLPTLQWCWSHLKRDFQALVDSGVAVARKLGRKLLDQTRILFRQWSRCRDGTITRAGLKSSLGGTRQETARLLQRGLKCRHDRTSEVCRELSWHQPRLWAFLDHPGVEPTNNASERALRHGVIWRKLSFGTQSAHGSRFVERLLTVIESCRQQGRDLFAFLVATITAHLHHVTPPSLVTGV